MKVSTKLCAAFILLAAIFSNRVNAQTMPANPWRFGLGLETGFTTGTLEKTNSFELGGTARLQYSVSSSFGIMLTSGYYNFFTGGTNSNNTTTVVGTRTYANAAHSQGVIPVKLGLKQFFTKSYYVSAEGGVGFETKYNEDKKLLLSPSLGWANKSWDVSARYENFSGQSNNYGLVGVRIAYGFKL